MHKNLEIAFLIPCFNEEATISNVVRQCHKTVPEAKIYVYDNNCSDKTAVLAKQAGAIVRHEKTQGKGNVVRRMFADIDADIYILCDGDMTYDIASTPKMMHQLITEKQDMVVGSRVSDYSSGKTYPPGHIAGNKMLTAIVGLSLIHI